MLVSHLSSEAGTWPISPHRDTACLSGCFSPTLIAAVFTSARNSVMLILLLSLSLSELSLVARLPKTDVRSRTVRCRPATAVKTACYNRGATLVIKNKRERERERALVILGS